MMTVTVELGARRYPIHIAEGLLDSLAPHLESLPIAGPIGLVSSPPIHERYGEALKAALSRAGGRVTTALISDGEAAKTLDTVAGLYDTFLEAGLDRGSTLVALGGGVVGDITGFVAATLFRGIACIQIPTSLLAMVDASVGGKTGVNHSLGKNLVGAFHQPRAVFVDTAVLKTLPRREITSALAEVLKYGAIADRDFFRRLVDGLDGLKSLSDMPLLISAITRSCQLKADLVAEDEREDGRRRLLNFGHTLGHALEGALGYGRLRHGEAVGLGMVAAGWLSTRIAGFPSDEQDLLAEAVERLELPPLPPLDTNEVLAFLQRDKKVRRGVRHFVLLEAIGRPVITEAVTDEQIAAALEELQGRFA